MAGCTITAGYGVPCKDYIGGIKALYFGALEDFATGVTITAGAVAELPTASIYKYDLKPGTGSYTDVPMGDAAAHTVYFEQTATAYFNALVLAKGVATERLDFEALARGRWVIFVQDSNDNIFMAGRIRGAELTSGDWTTGTGIGDANGYNCTFVATEAAPAPPLDDFTAVPFDNFAEITVVEAA